MARFRQMMWTALVATSLALALVCTKQKPPVADPGLDGYDDARLMALVRDGLPDLSLGACRSAALLGVLDDPDAGAKLDRLVERAATTAVDEHCVELLAAARIVRQGRLGELDLVAEMAHPVAVVRATALRYAVATQAVGARELVNMALHDGDTDVRVVALRVAASVESDSSLAAELQQLKPDGAHEVFWHCVALSRHDRTIECSDRDYAMDAIEPSAGPHIDRCAQARELLARGAVRDGLWFFLEDAFHRHVEVLDRLEPPLRDREPCRLDRRVEDEVLTADEAPKPDRAIVAATLLWEKHVPLGEIRTGLVRPEDVPLRRAVQSCVNDSHCAPYARCLRTSRQQREGVCGTPRSPKDRPRGGSANLACWSFADCPPFYSCYYLDPRTPYGVCLRP